MGRYIVRDASFKSFIFTANKRIVNIRYSSWEAEYFQQNGIPLTNDSDENNFARIKKIVKKYTPDKLIILGDLFHSKYSIDRTLQKKVEDLPEILKTNVELVLGNHAVSYTHLTLPTSR